MPSVRPPSALVLLAGLLAGCGASPGDVPPLECSALVAPVDAPDPVRPTDTLDVLLFLPPGTGRPLDVLVRVDSVASDGIVVFPVGVPATAVGAGATLTTRAVWTVCVSSAPRAIVFRTDAAPGKAWIRVSTDRPVRVFGQTGGAAEVTPERLLVVAPGHSSRRRWEPPGARR